MVNQKNKIWNKVNRKIEKFATCARIETRKIKREKNVFLLLSISPYTAHENQPLTTETAVKLRKEQSLNQTRPHSWLPKRLKICTKKLMTFTPAFLHLTTMCRLLKGTTFWFVDELGREAVYSDRSGAIRKRKIQCCYLHLRTLPNLEPKAGSFHPSPSWPPGLSACAQS